MKVTRSASGLGDRPAASMGARINASTGFLPQVVPLTGGTGGRVSLPNDQCSEYLAPSATHRLKRSICSGVNRGFFDLAGGMTASGSAEVIRLRSSLASGL